MKSLTGDFRGFYFLKKCMHARKNNGFFFSPSFSFSPYVVNCFAVFETWKHLYALQVDNILKKIQSCVTEINFINLL